ncbi:MAG: methyltransferase domain-containing protein [bacterium]|nr:methyltransferase domain-containing protein [bacterium]
MTDPIHVDTRSGYDRWATIYDEELNPLVLLEEPVVRAWVGEPKDLRVADVGCGTGRHAIWLATAGASVDAYDFSGGMLDKAGKKLADHQVRLHEHALPDPIPAEDATFDVTLLALVADHLEDVESAFRELRRVTRPGGQVLFTVLHPAMNLLGLTARFTDPDSGKEVRVAAHQHTYADYVMGALNADLLLEELVERKADQALVAKTPRAEKYLEWPLLLAMRLRRVDDRQSI